MARHLCNRCDDDWSDDVDGFCQSCRDELEEEKIKRVEWDEMSDEEYVAHQARTRSLRVTQAGITNLLEGIKRNVRRVA